MAFPFPTRPKLQTENILPHSSPQSHLGTSSSRKIPFSLIQSSIKKDIHKQDRLTELSEANALKLRLDENTRRAVDLASESGASSWLTSLPLTEFGFTLHKSAFRDALTLRYGWLPSHIPTHCERGAKFTIDHCLSCQKVGFPILRHNEVRDLTAHLLTEICHDVRVEPDLQPLSGETLARATSITQDGACLDIAANGFWGGRHQRTFLDVRIFNPHTKSYSRTPLSACYRMHENTKKRAYEQRILKVEHASFTLLVFSASGGLAKEATYFYKHLASRLAEKRDQPYSCTMNWLRCLLSFSLLRSAIRCFRGARSSKGSWVIGPQIPSDLINSEALLTNPS